MARMAAPSASPSASCVRAAQEKAHRLFVASLAAGTPEEHRAAIARLGEALCELQRAWREDREDMANSGFMLRQRGALNTERRQPSGHSFILGDAIRKEDIDLRRLDLIGGPGQRG